MPDDHHFWHKPVPDPHLEIGEGGGGNGLQKKFFGPFGPQFGLEIRGARNPPLQTV